MIRTMGLDVGDVRIGMAISDGLRCTAQPLGVYARRGPRQDITFLKDKVQELSIQEIVVGMPYKMAGGMSSMGQRISDFVDLLKTVCPVHIIFWSERLSSVEANRSMLEGDLSRKKRKSKVDVIAAQLILQGYLDSQRIQREREEEKHRWEGV